MKKIVCPDTAFVKKLLTLIAASIAILFFLSGCDSLLPPDELPPSPTPTQTETPTPTMDWFPATETPTPMPISSPTPEPVTEGQREGIATLLVEDDFTNENIWSVSQGGAGNVAYGNQNLTLAVARENASLSSVSEHVLPENFYLELTVQTTLCQPEDQVGVIFWHESEGDYYRLLLNCAGNYRLELIQGGQNFVIYDWEAASQIQLGVPATNHLGVWVYQGQFQFYINDSFQFLKQIARNRSGKLGVFARTVSGSAMTARISDLQIFSVSMD